MQKGGRPSRSQRPARRPRFRYRRWLDVAALRKPAQPLEHEVDGGDFEYRDEGASGWAGREGDLDGRKVPGATEDIRWRDKFPRLQRRLRKMQAAEKARRTEGEQRLVVLAG